MLRSLMTTVITLAMLAIGAPAEAQIVRIGGLGGVRVRAPGVSVDVGPYGSTRVRAPFTAVDSYGPRYPYGPVIAYRRAVVGVPVPPIPPGTRLLTTARWLGEFGRRLRPEVAGAVGLRRHCDEPRAGPRFYGTTISPLAHAKPSL